MSDGVQRTWNTFGGDEGVGDVIKFSLDCAFPQSSDYEMMRNEKPSYGTHQIKKFSSSGDYFFCWQPTFVQETKEPYFQAIYDLRYRIVSTPAISPLAVTTVRMNEDMARFDLAGTFAEGDKLAFSWKGLVITDCNPSNFIGSSYSRDFF